MIAIFEGMRGIGIILVIVAAFLWRISPSDEFLDFSETASVITVLSFVGGIVLLLGGGVLKSAAFRDASPQRSQIDVTGENRQPPAQALVHLREFEKMGFKRMGETLTTGPGMDAKYSTTWFMANPNGTIVLEAVQIEKMAMCQLTTVFADQAILETSYPVGEKIDKPNYYSRVTKKDIPTLYKEHVTLARELVKMHGKPRSMGTIAQQLQWDIVYRERYAKYKMGVTKELLDFAIIMTIIIGVIALFVLLGTA